MVPSPAGRPPPTPGVHRGDIAGVLLSFNPMTWIAGNEPVPAFDFNTNGRIDFADVVGLFNSF